MFAQPVTTAIAANYFSVSPCLLRPFVLRFNRRLSLCVLVHPSFYGISILFGFACYGFYRLFFIRSVRTVSVRFDSCIFGSIRFVSSRVFGLIYIRLVPFCSVPLRVVSCRFIMYTA